MSVLSVACYKLGARRLSGGGRGPGSVHSSSLCPDTRHNAALAQGPHPDAGDNGGDSE